MKVGAELSMMENRFTPARFKDGYGPVGAWFLLFKAKTLNGLGENFAGSDAAKAELEKYAPYGTAAITPTCLRNHLMLFEMKEGRGPDHHGHRDRALAELGKTMDKKELKHLESEAWEDFLDMTCWPGQPVVCHQHRAGEKELRDHAHRTVPAGVALRLLRSVDLRPGL
jgi:adenylylsulfate reductase subunit A